MTHRDSAPSVVVIPTARPTFVIEEAQDRAERARALLTELGARISGPRELVMTPEAIAAAAGCVDPAADLIVNVCASFSDASPALELYAGLDRPVLLWSFPEPGPVGDRLWLNSMCGANLFGHALVRAGGRVRWVHGDPDDPAVREALGAALGGELPPAPARPERRGARAASAEVRPALEGLRGRRIGIIGDGPTGFTPSEYDGRLLQDLFGLTVHRMELPEAFAAVAAVPPAEREAELAAAEAAQPSLERLDPGQLETFAAVTTVLRDYRTAAGLSAVAVRCWPEFPTQLGACPCSALGRIADEGTPTTCERDVYGAVTMLLAEALGAGTTYLVDTVDLDAAANVVRLWHCGSAATSLAADPDDATAGVHCNRKIGVAGNFPLRRGPVIMCRLTEDNDPDSPSGLRMLLAAGESIAEPNRFQGNTAAVRLESDAQQFVAGLITDGFPHHTVLAWTDVRPALRTAADLLGIPVVEWEPATAVTG